MGANENEYTPTTDDVCDVWVDRKLYHLPKSTAIELVPAAQAQFNRWLDQVKREARAEAWDEGAWHGYTNAPLDYKKNPYRAAQIREGL